MLLLNSKPVTNYHNNVSKVSNVLVMMQNSKPDFIMYVHGVLGIYFSIFFIGTQ